MKSVRTVLDLDQTILDMPVSGVFRLSYIRVMSGTKQQQPVTAWISWGHPHIACRNTEPLRILCRSRAVPGSARYQSCLFYRENQIGAESRWYATTPSVV